MRIINRFLDRLPDKGTGDKWVDYWGYVLLIEVIICIILAYIVWDFL